MEDISHQRQRHLPALPHQQQQMQDMDASSDILLTAARQLKSLGADLRANGQTHARLMQEGHPGLGGLPVY